MCPLVKFLNPEGTKSEYQHDATVDNVISSVKLQRPGKHY